MRKRIVLAMVLALILGLLTACGGPESTYKSAQDLLAKGKFTEAAEKFDTIGSYEDAASLAMYCKACALCEAGNYKAGIAALESLAGFKDSAYRIDYYNARSLDDLSANTTEFEQMEQARYLYSQNSLYLDSAERIVALDERITAVKSNLYNEAIQSVENDDYKNAQEIFDRLGVHYMNSATWSTYCEACLCEMNASTDESMLKAQQLYESIADFEDSNNRATNLYHKRVITFPEERYYFANGMIAAKKDNKWGFINTTGKVVSEPQWDYFSFFTLELPAILQTEELDHIIDIIDNSGFNEGLLAVKKGNKWGYIDTTGKVVSEPQWDYASIFIDGLAVVAQNYKYGFINTAGEVVIEPQWYNAKAFNGGMAKIKMGSKYGFADTTGKVVIEPQWDLAAAFSEGLAMVSTGDFMTSKWGFIDTTGKVVIEPQWDVAESFSEGLAAVGEGDYVSGKWGYIDTTGEVVIEQQWDAAGPFSEGLAAVKKNNKWGYIDTTGEVVIEQQWDAAGSFSEGLAAVKKNNKWGYIDTTGKFVIEPQWDYVGNFSRGLAFVEKNDKYVFIDAEGNILFGWR